MIQPVTSMLCMQLRQVQQCMQICVSYARAAYQLHAQTITERGVLPDTDQQPAQSLCARRQRVSWRAMMFPAEHSTVVTHHVNQTPHHVRHNCDITTHTRYKYKLPNSRAQTYATSTAANAHNCMACHAHHNKCCGEISFAHTVNAHCIAKPRTIKCLSATHISAGRRQQHTQLAVEHNLVEIATTDRPSCQVAATSTLESVNHNNQAAKCHHTHQQTHQNAAAKRANPTTNSLNQWPTTALHDARCSPCIISQWPAVGKSPAHTTARQQRKRPCSTKPCVSY